MSVRKIAVISSSRADYSHLYWPMKAMLDHPALDPQLILYGAHLSPQFGHTGAAADRDGLPVRARLECLLSSDSDVGMAKTIGLATLSLADELARERPDIMLLIADRYEMLAAASVALALRLPMAHIEGGEVSQGAIDDAVRNALTKLAHLHLTPHEQASRRVAAMGEAPDRIQCVGAPSLDHLRHSQLLDPQALHQALDLPADGPLAVVATHPVTLSARPWAESAALFQALEHWEGSVAFCFPNADAGSHRILQMARDFCATHPRARLYVNLDLTRYFSLLSCADLIAGNSSSAIMEAASFQLPAVNVGTRQLGRLMAANVISVEADPAAISGALRQAATGAFRSGLNDLINPYGDGRAGPRIAAARARMPLDATTLRKPPAPLPL